VDSPIISDDEIKDSKEQKGNNKRSKRSDVAVSPIAKRLRRQLAPTIISEIFRKSESFDRPEFVQWLNCNQHSRAINGGTSTICELLDKVRVENPGLNEIFLAFADNGIVVNPQFFDIAALVRPNDSIIFPPKWNKRTDAGATYVWSFDTLIKDVKTYCKEIQKDISDHPHTDTDTADYRPIIAAQFRHYLENELPLDKKVKVFRWLYVGQTIKSPPYKRWRN
jgi:hypothetical protein